MKKLSVFVFTVSFALITAGANATPIHYVESIDGPLDPNNPLIMGAGTNVIEGNDCWTNLVPCRSIPDFVFEIPTGMTLVNYRYAFSDIVFESTPPLTWTGSIVLRGLDDPTLFAITNSANWLIETMQTLSLTNLDWSSGTYRQFLSSSRTGYGGTWDFRIELDVISTFTEIPLPATVLFFGLGLGLAGLIRRHTYKI